MTTPARSRTGLRRPLAIASVIALVSGLFLSFATPASAAVAPGKPTNVAVTITRNTASVTFTAPANTGGAPVSVYTVTAEYGGTRKTCAADPTRSPLGCTVTSLSFETTYNFSVTARGIGGVGQPSTSVFAKTPRFVSCTETNSCGGSSAQGGDSPHGEHGNTGTIECVDDNLDLLSRGLGGAMYALEIDGHCLVLHRFNTSQTFDIVTRPGFPMQILVVGGGGGAGGGSGWEDSTKSSGAEPESGAGAGGAGGNVLSADVRVDPATGAFTYTPTDPENIDGSFVYTPTAIPPGSAPFPFSDPAGRTLTTGITVGFGGFGGTAGTSVAGSTVGGQGTAGGESTFGSFRAGGGGGGFGGRGGDGGAGDVQNSLLSSLRAGGQRGGSNGAYFGFNLGSSPTIDHAAPGGAGAAEDGHGPTAVGTTGNGGSGGAGVVPVGFFASNAPTYGSGGGGGTISPASPPFAAVTGGAGGPEGYGGNGAAGGNGEDARNGFGGGGGGGGTDGSVTVGDSNAGVGGNGGDGVVFVRYLALAVPATPAAPSVVAGDSSAILTITPLADTPDQYVVWVVGEPDKQCTVTPPETSCAIEGLTNGQDYTFETYAWNKAGESESSADTLTITPSADAGALPYTGNNTRSLGSLALIMIGLGGGFTALASRRRTIA